MKIDHLVRPDVLERAPTDTLRTIAQGMGQHHVSALAVVEEVGLVGMIPERNLVRGLAAGVDPAHAQVHDYRAVREVAAPREDSRQVAQRMLDSGLDHIQSCEAQR